MSRDVSCFAVGREHERAACRRLRELRQRQDPRLHDDAEPRPGSYRLRGTVSDKALYYDDDLRPGTVLLFDDVSLSVDLQEVLKSATANFREPIEHRTLTTERKLRVCTIRNGVSGGSRRSRIWATTR